MTTRSSAWEVGNGIDFDAAAAVGQDARAAAESFDDDAAGFIFAKLSGLRVCGAMATRRVKFFRGERCDRGRPVAMKARMPPA